ncbi:MAG: hypothetical protein ACYDAR_01825 [Thermomicrobiales bacterium]
MAVFFQLWNDETNNIIDEFDTEQDAADEVLHFYLAGGVNAIHRLSLLRFDTPDAPKVIAMGDDLLAYVTQKDLLPGD